jgi:hypothetical protein
MGESAEGRSFFFGAVFALGVLARVFAEASRFLSVSRFSLCSRSRGGAFGRARAAASGLGFRGEDTLGAWSSSSGRRIGGPRTGVFERELGCDSAILGVVARCTWKARAVLMAAATGGACYGAPFVRESWRINPTLTFYLSPQLELLRNFAAFQTTTPKQISAHTLQ